MNISFFGVIKVNANTRNKYLKIFLGVLLGFLFLQLFMSFIPVYSADNDNDGIDDTTELNLLKKYSPILYFRSTENFYPVKIEYHVQNSKLYNRSGSSVTLIDANPDPTTLNTYQKDSYFLNNTNGGLEGIKSHYKSSLSSLGYTIYGRVYNETYSGVNYTIVQYWFFYAYNDADFNQHEGDWEMIQIVLDASMNPIYAAYSQHNGGERASWSAVWKTDTHPHVYVARGSHANYFRPFQGNVGLEMDDVGQDGLVLEPSDYSLIMLGESGTGNHNTTQNWLDYGGRWGTWDNPQDASVGFAGPTGPCYKYEKWYIPHTWALENTTEVGEAWFLLNWLLANFGWLILIVGSILVIYKTYKVIKLAKTDGIQLPKIMKTRGAIGVIGGITALICSYIAAFMPYYYITANINTSVFSTGGDATIILFDGIHGIQVNFLINNQGLTSYFNFGLPIGFIILLTATLSVLTLLGAKNSRKLGNGYIKRGIIFIVIFIILIVIIAQLGSMITYFATLDGSSLPAEIQAIINIYSSNPLFGSASTTVGSFGTVALVWSIATGVWLLLAAAFIRIFSGIILRTVPEEPKE